MLRPGAHVMQKGGGASPASQLRLLRPAHVIVQGVYQIGEV
jgi:hypothetical protein